MLIRNQNKSMLINLDKIAWISNYNNDIVISDVPVAKREDLLCIGKYSTEEKALKVLNGIENKYDELNAFLSRRNTIDGYTFAIFQMPQDNEL